ncbi:MAG: S-adenosylmethionine:tRNA ribosyltransferase-isomerase [Ruminococcus sp.]|nr:S-adenosylmethionine:tRNA ribosyltransferase-isomerase [Ruminococcus sp.]
MNKKETLCLHYLKQKTEHAVEEKYRFFSFGDSMCIL